MKSLVFQGTRRVEYGEWQDPQPSEGEVLIQVAACGICGTDMHVYHGMPATWPVPGVRGHEFSGTVLAWGDNVTGFEKGDRVVIQPLIYCRRCPSCQAGYTNLCSNVQLVGGERAGGFAERAVVPADRVFKIPDMLGLEIAALTESLATSVHAFQANVTGLVRRVAVLGAGPQGLFAVQLARLAGAQMIMASDVIPARLELARTLGATDTFDARRPDLAQAILALTNGEGADLIIEAAGKAVTRALAVQFARPGGTIVFLALGAEPTALDFMSIVPRELKLHGTQCYTDADFVRSIELLATGRIDGAAMQSVFPLSEGAAVFERLGSNPGDAAKVLLAPNGAR
ncbi:MAG: alcohol dehydrogenase catalytic domain-containing protein [Anaerolineae bacterium]|nr:alcohol dehydrogenase catalytic domain-containing protein [Anaerolineae bacterium]